ncbi:MAG TPA: hypothetical protein VE994_12800 [Terriglobales bacterium]|nr:hypothetical protein [Terriglobales bacterium]
MTNFLSMIALNVVMFFGLILSMPASALAQQEVDPSYYEPVPTQTAQQAAKRAESAKPAKQDKKVAAKAHHKSNNSSQQLIAKK